MILPISGQGELEGGAADGREPEGGGGAGVADGRARSGEAGFLSPTLVLGAGTLTTGWPSTSQTNFC